MNRTVSISYAMYFRFWNISETWKTGCHFILCTTTGNDAITILENHFQSTLIHNEGESGLGNTKGKKWTRAGIRWMVQQKTI